MRVVSLVPSTTETLLAWGIEPVACTRFCEQPQLRHVGGTKDPDIDAIIALEPDLVVVDKPAGLPVVPSRRWGDDSVVGALSALGLGPALPVHLLDPEASGLVVLSGSPEAAASLRWNWRSPRFLGWTACAWPGPCCPISAGAWTRPWRSRCGAAADRCSCAGRSHPIR